MNILNDEQQRELDAIIEEMKEEGEGSRGIFYENFGSSISSALLPLAKLIEESPDKETALKVALLLSRGY